MSAGRKLLTPVVVAAAVARRRGAQRTTTDPSSARQGGRGPGRPSTSGRQGRAGAPSRSGVPGSGADKPTEIPAAGWKQILRRALKEVKQDNVGLLAAGLAYYIFLALFPALIAAVTLYGLVADPAQVEAQIQSLSDSLPPETATLIGDQLRSISSGASSTLGLGLVVSVLGALFTASGGVGNLMKAVNLAYDEEETRGFVKLRGTALLLTLGAVVFVVVAVGLVAVLPVVFESAGLGGFGRLAAGVLRWVALVGFMAVALAVLYRYAPDRDHPRFAWLGLGSVVATVVWVVASAGFSLYVSNFGSYGKTYGALAGVVVLLIWLYLTAFVILLGAEINSETEQQTAKDTTTGPEQPMGQRDAVKADSVATG